MRRYMAILATIVALLGVIGISQGRAEASQGSARIDLYVTSGYGAYTPCVRDQISGSRVRYFCRSIYDWNYTLDSGAVAWTWARAGDASGGNGYAVLMNDGQIFEGCDVPDYYGNNFNCLTGTYQMSSREYSTNAWNLYANAAWTWAQNQYTAAACLYAMYNQDPLDTANSCQ